MYFVKRFWSYVHVKGAIEVLDIINIVINNINKKKPRSARSKRGKMRVSELLHFSKLPAWLPDGLSQSPGAPYYAKPMWLVENVDTFSRFYTSCDAIARIKI